VVTFYINYLLEQEETIIFYKLELELESDKYYNWTALASVFCCCDLFMHCIIFQMEEEFLLLRNAFTKALIADEHIACILLVSGTFYMK